MKGNARSKAVQDEWNRIMPRRVSLGRPTRDDGEHERKRRMATDGGDADGNVEPDSGRPNVRAAVNNAGPVMAQASDDDAVHADRNSVT